MEQFVEWLQVRRLAHPAPIGPIKLTKLTLSILELDVMVPGAKRWPRFEPGDKGALFGHEVIVVSTEGVATWQPSPMIEAKKEETAAALLPDAPKDGVYR